MKLPYLFILVTACGEDTKDPPEHTSADQFAARLIAAECEHAVRCEQVPDRATCESALRVDGELETIRGALANGSIIYDETAAAACVAAISARDCAFAGFHQTNACDDVFSGTVVVGGECFLSLQCADDGDCMQIDADCDAEDQCCSGACMAASVIESPIGGPCEDELHYCGRNAYCKVNQVGVGVCAAPVTVAGGLCDAVDGCSDPMYCDIDEVGTGICKSATPSSATCALDDAVPCADSRDYCDPTTLTCTRAVAVGEVCADDVPCVGYAACLGERCVANHTAGEACVIDGDQSCLASLECSRGTCQLPPLDERCL